MYVHARRVVRDMTLPNDCTLVKLQPLHCLFCEMIKRAVSVFPSLADVPEAALAGYKAAGVLPCFRDGSEVWFLVGRDQPRNRRGDDVWSDFGGKVKREDGNDQWVTAEREFSEETADLGLAWHPKQGDAMSVVSNTSGKYLLFVVSAPRITVPSSIIFPYGDKKQFAWVKGLDVAHECGKAQKNVFSSIPGYGAPGAIADPRAQVNLYGFFAHSIRLYLEFAKNCGPSLESSTSSSSSSSATNVLGLDGSAGGGGGKSAASNAIDSEAALVANGGGGVGREGLADSKV